MKFCASGTSSNGSPGEKTFHPIKNRTRSIESTSIEKTRDVVHGTQFLSGMQADEVFYGHFMPYKAGTTPQVTKLVLMADEYLGAGIVMQFDLTGIDKIAGGYGLAIYKKK